MLGLALFALPASAQQVHVLIINGLAGEPKYRAAFDSVATTLADSAKKRWNVADSSLIVLSEEPMRGAATYIRGKSTRDEIAKMSGDIRGKQSGGAKDSTAMAATATAPAGAMADTAKKAKP